MILDNSFYLYPKMTHYQLWSIRFLRITMETHFITQDEKTKGKLSDFFLQSLWAKRVQVVVYVNSDLIRFDVRAMVMRQFVASLVCFQL